MSKADAVFEKINARLAKIDRNNRQLEHIYKFKITGTDKSWVLDLKAIKLYAGDDPADVTLTCDEDTVALILSNQLSVKDAHDQGKLKVEGEFSYALKLMPFIATL